MTLHEAGAKVWEAEKKVREIFERQPPELPPFDVSCAGAPVYNPPGSGLVQIDEVRGTLAVTDGGVIRYISPATMVPEGKRVGCTCTPEHRATCANVTCPWRPL